MSGATVRPTRIHIILVRGQVSEKRAAWFEGFTMVDVQEQFTLLVGTTRDESELQGALTRIFGVGLEIVFVQTIPARLGSEKLSERCKRNA